MTSEPLSRDSVARNAFFALAARIGSAVFTGGVLLFLVRALGPEGYGIYALALAIAGLILIPGDLGITQAAARFVAERRGNRVGVAETLMDSIALKALIAVVLNGGLLLAAGPIAAAYGADGLAWPLRGIAIAQFAQSIMLLVNYAFTAQGRVSLNVRVVYAESAVEATSVVALVLLGAGAAGATFGRALGYAFGSALAVVLMSRFLGRRILPTALPPRSRLRTLARYAGALSIVDLAWTVLGTLDALLIGALLTPAAVGLFQAPLKLLLFAELAGGAVTDAIAPRLARRPGHDPETDAFVRTLRYLILLHTPLAVALLVWAEPIVRLTLGEDYLDSVDVTRVFSAFVLVSGFGTLVSITVNYLGEARRRIPVALTAIVAVAAIDLALIPRLGITGAAIGASVGMAIYVGGHLRIAATALSLDLRPVGVTATRALVAGTALAAVLLSLGTSNVGVLDWGVALAGGGAAYLLMLALLRELTRAELAHARELLRRV